MLVPAAWIAACEARAASCRPGISPIRWMRSSTPSSARLARRYGPCRACFRGGRFRRQACPSKRRWSSRASAHLAILRADGARRGSTGSERTVRHEDRPGAGSGRTIRCSSRMCGRPAPPASSRRLHHLNDGRAWPADEIAKRKAEIEAAGLTWDVVESIVVHEDIKTRSGRSARADRQLQGIDPRRRRRRHQDGLLQFHGDHRLDAHRSRLSPMPHGGTALRFDIVDFCAYDVLVLKRAGAEADHPAERIAAAQEAARRDERKRAGAARANLIGWVPAREFIFDRESFRKRARRLSRHLASRACARISSPSCARSFRSPRKPASGWPSIPTIRRSRSSACRAWCRRPPMRARCSTRRHRRPTA